VSVERTEWDLVRLAGSGDKEAFRELVERYQRDGWWTDATLGEAVVIRVLDRTVVSLDLNKVGMSPEMPCAQSARWPALERPRRAGGGRNCGCGKRTCPASCWKSWTSLGRMWRRRSSSCARVQAVSKARVETRNSE
jgi:hypothetical protein